MNFLDAKYINLISPQLVKFSKKKSDLYTFRCPYCGDSSKNRNKTRGYFYRKRNDFFFKCHNCGVGRTFTNFLKDNDTLLHDEYILERYKEGLTGKGSNTPEPDFKMPAPVFKKDIFSNLKKVNSLNKEHPARAYLSQRQIPESLLSIFYYAEDFNAWAKLNNNQKESRIVIPLISQDGKVFGYQGRSLDKNTKLRYITTILDKSYPKLFGLERVNNTQRVYVTEGPFDSLFLSNAIAMCGSDVTLDDAKFNDLVYVLDNEPRNREIVNKYEKLIKSGNSIVIWPHTVSQKDLNDMKMSGHDVQSMVESNTYQGLEAIIKLNAWKKV
jgi:hypothetical protein